MVTTVVVTKGDTRSLPATLNPKFLKGNVSYNSHDLKSGSGDSYKRRAPLLMGFRHDVGFGIFSVLGV